MYLFWINEIILKNHVEYGIWFVYMSVGEKNIVGSLGPYHLKKKKEKLSKDKPKIKVGQ